jgi:hypothetical protein
MSYFIWIPTIIILYALQAFLTVKVNQVGGKWTWIMTAVCMLPPWVLISRYSKNLILDAMIFDAILVIAYSIGLLHFTNSWAKFEWNNWLGFALMILGVFVFKKGL